MEEDRIEANPDIMFGKPCIKGTRIPVDRVLQRLAAGEPIEQLLAAWESSHVTREDVLACIDYAAKLVNVYWETTREER